MDLNVKKTECGFATGVNESREGHRFECLTRRVEVLEQIFILVQRKKGEKWKGSRRNGCRQGRDKKGRDRNGV